MAGIMDSFGEMWRRTSLVQRVLLVGIALGVLGAVAVAGVTASLLYGVEPLNPLFLVGVGLFLVLVAGMATFAPALRALRIDPTEAMRLE